jgi:hypothetical protein
MTTRREYKVISENNPAQLGVQLTQLGQSGWKPILMTTIHAAGAAGIGNVITTVIVEHESLEFKQ